MWQVKTWTLAEKAAYLAWIARHEASYQITELFINNGYGVEYRPLRKAY